MWERFANCRPGYIPEGAWWSDYNFDIFFPERGNREAKERARWSCFTCPVQQQCRERQVMNGEEYGIWAGKFASNKEEEDDPS